MKKHGEVVDLETACSTLVAACDDFIEKNKDSPQAKKAGLFSKSPLTVVRDLKKELKDQVSVDQLIGKIKEYKQDHELAKKFRELVVTKIYQTHKEEINRVRLDISRQNLVTASRGFSVSIKTNPAPDINAAIDQLFLDYCKAAKSTAIAASIELN